MTFCDRQTSVIVYTRPYNRVHTSYLLVNGPSDMPGIPQAAFMTRLLQFSLRPRDYLLSHYFPELAPICRMSGLMGSDVKIDHNLQFARPLPPVMMPRPALSLS